MEQPVHPNQERDVSGDLNQHPGDTDQAEAARQAEVQDVGPSDSAARAGTPDGEAPDSRCIRQGLDQHGDAFRAYLQLPDTDPHRDDLLETFQDFYVGTFNNIDELLEQLTEVRDCETAIDRVAAEHGFPGLGHLDRSALARITRDVWDIVVTSGGLHVFEK
jgi:hypothetical protein